ncbi:MAG: hypothetical protein AB7E45_00265 [Candidatus Caldatribacteriota bacterium]
MNKKQQNNMENLIKELLQITKKPSAIVKILMDLGYDKGYNPDTIDAINYILYHFCDCVENIDGFEDFPRINKKEQERLLYVMLTMVPVDLTSEELSKWALIGNNKDWVNVVIKDCVEKKKERDFEEILELAYEKFLYKVGKDLVETLIKYSE